MASPSRLEFVILTFTILALAGALAAFLPYGQTVQDPASIVEAISEGGDATKQIILSGLYATNLILLVWFVRPWAWSFIGLPILALVLLCFASAGWSEIPDGTVRRAIAMAGVVIVGLYAGARFDERQLTAALCMAAALAVIGSIIWAIAFHSLGFDRVGNMRGLFYHKNAFGAFLSLSITAVVYRVYCLRCRGLSYVALLLGLAGCLVLSRSATSTVALVAAVGALVVVISLQRSDGLLRAVLPLSVGVAVVVVLVLGSDLGAVVAGMLGRDPSLSGRTSIWEFVLPMIGDRPWAGYGYGIFWLGDTAPGSVFWYWSKQYELHAHDGFLELMLDVGAAGLALFVFSLVLLLRRTTALSNAGLETLPRWIAIILTYFLVSNITDTQLMQPNSLLTALYVWAVTRINLETWRQSAQEALISTRGLSLNQRQIASDLKPAGAQANPA